MCSRHVCSCVGPEHVDPGKDVAGLCDEIVSILSLGGGVGDCVRDRGVGDTAGTVCTQRYNYCGVHGGKLRRVVNQKREWHHGGLRRCVRLSVGCDNISNNHSTSTEPATASKGGSGATTTTLCSDLAWQKQHGLATRFHTNPA